MNRTVQIRLLLIRYFVSVSYDQRSDTDRKDHEQKSLFKAYFGLSRLGLSRLSRAKQLSAPVIIRLFQRVLIDKPPLSHAQHTPFKHTVGMMTNIDIGKDVDLRNCAGVGQGISKRMADDVRMKIELIPTTPFYQQKEAAGYPFEALDSNAIVEVVNPAIDAWFSDDKNIERTAQRFGITSSNTFKLLAWSVIRTRDVKTPKQIIGGLFNIEHEIDIFIALGDWKESNGIFALQKWPNEQKGESRHDCGDSAKNPLPYIELKSGEDVSVKGADTLFFSGKAGGLALMLRLQFPFA